MRDPALADLIGNATRRAFVRIVDLCLEEQVDALMLAGDLYDGDQTSMKTARFLAGQVHRLHEAGVGVFVIRGNHDALSRITQELVFPESVKVFGGRADAVAVVRGRGDVPIAVHGLSFTQSKAPESLVGKYKPPLPDAVNIGLMHTSLAGSDAHDVYAPCSIADLRRMGFRYWGLGHIHRRLIDEGDCTVAMPGMPQGRDINEAGAKSVSLVTVGDDRSIRVEERVTSLAEFGRVSVDVTGLADWRDLAAALTTALGDARSGIASDHLVARLRLTGATPLAWRIRRDLDLLVAEAEQRAALIGGCWIEKIEVECHPSASTAGPAGPLGELRRLIDHDILGSEAYRQEIAQIVDELSAQLPQECRDVLGGSEAGSRQVLDKLQRAGTDEVMARLHTTPAPGEH